MFWLLSDLPIISLKGPGPSSLTIRMVDRIHVPVWDMSSSDRGKWRSRTNVLE